MLPGHTYVISSLHMRWCVFQIKTNNSSCIPSVIFLHVYNQKENMMRICSRFAKKEAKWAFGRVLTQLWGAQKYICRLFWQLEVYQCLRSRAGERGDNQRRFVERRTPRRCLICPIKCRRPASSSPVSESFHPLSGWRTTLLMMVRKMKKRKIFKKE